MDTFNTPPEDKAVQLVAPMIIERDPDGKFLSRPEGSGRKPGSLNRVSRQMQEALAREMELDVDNNPLTILLRIARNIEYPAMVRIQAADRLARYLAPRLMQVEIETPDATFEVETQKVKAKLRGMFLGGE